VLLRRLELAAHPRTALVPPTKQAKTLGNARPDLDAPALKRRRTSAEQRNKSENQNTRRKEREAHLRL
jgi:hypothetical protein